MKTLNMDDTLIEESASAAAINSILKKYADETNPNASKNYASSKHIEEIKAQTIVFYFGDEVIGEVKFIKAGSKAEKIERSKKKLMKEVQEREPGSQIAQRLYSQFCNFKFI